MTPFKRGGGAIAITGNRLALGNLNTSRGFADAGSVTLTAINDISVNDVIASGNGYSGGNINVTSNAGNITFRDLNSTTVNSLRFQPVAGNIQLTALAGSITANSINASAIKTDGSGDFTSTAGAVNLTARNNITVIGEINTTALATNVDGDAGAIGGNVTLTSTNPTPGNNIRFGSINTQATIEVGAPPTGGTVQILTNGRVQGTGTTATGDTINTQSVISDLGASLPGGAVTIQQDGGADNTPFTIGNPALNGTASSINVGGGSILSAGSFAVLPNGGTAAGTPPNIAIISINTPPTVTTNPLLSTNALPNQALPFVFTANTGDANLDNATVIIDAVLAGTLRRGNTILNPGDSITPGETLNYTPPNNTIGLVNALRIRASDRVSTSAPQRSPSIFRLPL
ncbi:MAG: hypothetical protein HC780_03330 [Leptolyngbyaceae cyanobacterium CSU_1_3]|nr:hypothetical protein [Leptolyngbyaceae cyanobacterium CSU_1_3]